MPRRKIYTQERLMEDLLVLAEHVNEEGVCQGVLPVEILRLHHGYEKAAPFYREVRTLQEMGHLATHPPGAVTFQRGYRIVGFDKHEVLKKKLQNVYRALATAALELQGIASEINYVAADKPD